MLHQLPDDERVSDQQAHYVWRSWAKLSTKDHSVIEADKLHQITWADGVIDHSVQLLIVFCFANGFIKLFDVGMTNLCLNRSHHFCKWFSGNDTKSLDRNLLHCHFTPSFRFRMIFLLTRVTGLLPLNPFPDISLTLTKFYALLFLVSEEANHFHIHQCHLAQI